MNHPRERSEINVYSDILSQPDAILEPNIFQTAIKKYVDVGGTPMDAVSLLSQSYKGIPSACNVVAQAADAVGLDSRHIIQSTLKRLLVDHFDPKRCDQMFTDIENLAWVNGIIDDAEWRQLIYQLLQEHPNSTFLNAVVLRAARSGYESEVITLRTASAYIEIYNGILTDAFTKILPKDDLEIKDAIPELVKACCEHEHTYLYAQILIQKLINAYDTPSFRLLSRELERAAIERRQQTLVEIIRAHLTDAPLELVNVLRTIRRGGRIASADVMNIYKIYTEDESLPVSHLCQSDILEVMLKTIFVPSYGHMRSDILTRLIHLVAYATTINDALPRQEQMPKVDRVFVTLKELNVALREKAKGADLIGAVKPILGAIGLPVAAAALLLWIEYTSIETQYYETYYRTAETPMLHHLLDEIASRHPLQRPMVFAVVKKCLLHHYENFAPEILMTLQQTWIERLVYLVQLHYTIPVLSFMKDVGREIDNSSIVHFLRKLLAMAKPPFDPVFVEYVADIFGHVMDNVDLIRDVHLSAIEFFELAERGSEPLSNELKGKIEMITKQRRKPVLRRP